MAGTDAPEGAGPQSIYLPAPDGLRLHARLYKSAPGTHGKHPIVCLPGLARTADDFDDLARHLSRGENARRVICLDYRGRGLSERDKDWKNYDVRVELADTLSVLDALGIERAILIGTSRGGLITMALSAVRPTLIAGAVLNDIGPVIERQGLLRIKGYVGKLPVPRNWDEAGEILQRLSDGQFAGMYADAWRKAARLTWHETPSGLALSYDPALLHAVAGMDLEKPLPELWQYFDGLADVPILVIRGENSDILSEETVGEMQMRHPALAIFHALGQGHAPFLDSQVILTRLQDFILSVEKQ